METRNATKVDTAYVEDALTQGITIEAFHICDLKEAVSQAANMSAYHKREFRVVVRNEGRTPMTRKTVALDKDAKWLLKNKLLSVAVLHENAITKNLEKVA